MLFALSSYKMDGLLSLFLQMTEGVKPTLTELEKFENTPENIEVTSKYP